MHLKTGNRHLSGERGQVVVFFALLVPVIFAIGSIVVSAGNWYVLKRHLQTQVDAAAIAGGHSFTGCFQDAAATNLKIAQDALKYSGDTARAGTYNLQPEDTADVRVVLNSTNYWDEVNASTNTNGTGYDNTIVTPQGTGPPCTTKSLDVKATDFHVPNLFGWIPLFPSVKARALVEIHKIQATNGVLPVGVPEFDPVRVGVVFVDEDGSGPSSVRGTSFLTKQSLPAGDPLAGMGVWRQDVGGVNFNGADNFSTVIVASRDPAMSLTGTLSTICSQNPVQTHCYAGSSLTSGLSFIHSYKGSGSGTTDTPIIRQVELAGGCGPSGSWSNPYFNVDDDVSCNAIQVQAVIDWGASGDPRLDPTCGRVTASPGGAMTWSPGGIGGALGTWTAAFTPALQSGRTVVNLSTTRKQTGSVKTNCSQLDPGPTFSRVAAPYVADDASGPVQYLKIENLDPPFGLANSIVRTVSANVRVTAGFVPPLRDTPLSDPPITLRFGSGPSQTHALDCGTSGSGPNGFRGNMVRGCDEYQVNARNGSCATPYPVPPDCIDSENGSFNNKGIEDRFAKPCTPNNWNGVTVPPESDPRWIVLFILDDVAFSVPGKKTYPVRRFGGFYVTAGDGMGCPGDDPASVNRTELWGHFITYVHPDFGDTIPSPLLCDFALDNACVPGLVE
jgi:Putative Flp pilus-assembly TadE/G-like